MTPSNLTAELRTAVASAHTNRGAALVALNRLFRAGAPPASPLHGPLAGSLGALDIAPGLTQLAQAVARAWLPWKGKTFDSTSQSGQNIFVHEALPLVRVAFPFYRGVGPGSAQTFLAFRFRTWLGPGLLDPDRTVLKIDYDSADNPGLTIRRVLDELVQIGEGVYLGKAHFKWWWGRWQTVAYFLLER